MATQINPEDFDGFDDYCDALRSQKSLTPTEFACLLQQSIAYGQESYAEHYTQYRSECALFGDAGPGQATAYAQIGKMVKEDIARLARVRRIAMNLGA